VSTVDIFLDDNSRSRARPIAYQGVRALSGLLALKDTLQGVASGVKVLDD
jgi:hypothetical protein